VQGGSSPPSRNPRKHGTRLREDLKRAIEPPLPRNRVEGVDPRCVFKIETSNRLSDAADTMRKRGLRVLGETDGAIYFVTPRLTTAEQLIADADTYAEGPDEEDGKGKGRTFFDNVEEISGYGPEDRRRGGVPDPNTMSDDAEVVVDVCAWPSSTSDEAAERVKDIRAACGSEKVLGLDVAPRTTVVRVRVGPAELAKALNLCAVESIRLPIGPEVEPSDWIQLDVAGLQVPQPLDAVVGVIDDGVIDHPLLSRVIVARKSFPEHHDFGSIGTHGTAVAGLAAYGGFESALQGGGLATPVSVAVARVLQESESAGVVRTAFPSDIPDHDVVRQAAEWLVNTCGARVINFSIADPWPFEGPHAGPLTETIDRLSRELDVVFVVSTGNASFSFNAEAANGEHAYQDYPSYLFSPSQRIAEPAIAASALTVGSVSATDAGATADGTSRVDDHVIAASGDISPFSRTGPGIRDAVKPEVVADGGSLVWSSTGLRMVDLGASIVSLNSRLEERGFRATRGTSFSAARVANIAGQVAHRYPEASANYIRAVTVLSTAARMTGLEDEHRLLGVGFGEPNVARATDSGGSRAVMSFDGSVLTDSASIHAVPIPSEFSSTSTRRRMRIAVAFDPPVRRERRDYLGGHLALNLYRGETIEHIAAIHQEQIDAKSAVALPSDRRRFLDKFAPNKTRLLTSTLQLHTWDLSHSRSLNVDDGELYYLVVTHVSSPWAEHLGDAYEAQPYALAVELEDLESVDVELHVAVERRITIEEQTRIRL